MSDDDCSPIREHLICAVGETSPLWRRYVLAVQQDGATDQWTIAIRSSRLFWTRHHDWMPDLCNAARFPEEKALRIARSLTLGLVVQGMGVAETLRNQPTAPHTSPPDGEQ